MASPGKVATRIDMVSAKALNTAGSPNCKIAIALLEILRRLGQDRSKKGSKEA
jgi:hypothetical protein